MDLREACQPNLQAYPQETLERYKNFRFSRLVDYESGKWAYDLTDFASPVTDLHFLICSFALAVNSDETSLQRPFRCIGWVNDGILSENLVDTVQHEAEFVLYAPVGVRDKPLFMAEFRNCVADTLQFGTCIPQEVW